MIASDRDGEDDPSTLSAMADDVTDLSPTAAAARLADGWQALDVRLAHERVEDGTIADDVHIELAELSARAGEVDPARSFVVYCHSGVRSAMAVAALRGAGYDAHNLAGGIVAWVAAGLPVKRGA
jgi:rhodanese-related sulfurtransferase